MREKKVICKKNYFMPTVSYHVNNSLVFMEGVNYDYVDTGDYYEIYSVTMKRNFIISKKGFGIWFLTEKELRKQKLERLNEL